MSIIGNMLTERQEKLLNILIDVYIKTAEPVSSKSLEKSRFFDVSSATLRNEMNELEQMGYLAQLHTSGGRVPTDKGYRFYVDIITDTEECDIPIAWQKKIDSILSAIGSDPHYINKTVAQLMSDLSDNVVIAGIAEDEDFYKTGLASLFEHPEFKEMDRVFNLMSFFDEFDRIFDQMEREFFGDIGRNKLFEDLNIFIGIENKIPAVQEETIMTSRYDLPENIIGSLTLIGPTRMDYKKNIGLVRYTIDKLNKIAKEI